MAKSKGSAFLLKISDGGSPATFTAFTGLTAKGLEINNEAVDVTTPGTDPAAAIWAESLAGVKAVKLSGDFTKVADVSEAELVGVAMDADPVRAFQVVIPDIGTFEGNFRVSVTFNGDDKVTGSMSLDSTGEVTFTAA